MIYFLFGSFWNFVRIIFQKDSNKILILFEQFFLFNSYKYMNNFIKFRPRLFDAIKSYSVKDFSRDAMAGTIVGIVALPLAIAFGIASGVSPEVGLMTAIIGGFIVSFFGGSSVQIGGPTGAFIVIVYGVIQQYGIDGLIISTILAGILLLLMGFLRLGTLIRFIPYPIIVGFTAGIAITIFSTQINDLLGLGISDMPAAFVSKWISIFSNLNEISWISLIIGLLSIIIIQITPKISKQIPGSLVAIVLMTIASYLLNTYFNFNIDIISNHYKISGELPDFVIPNLDFDKLSMYMTPAFTIAMLGAIESLLSASVADGVISERHDSNTELVAQGLANIVVPFIGGIPVTGAIARTMTNINNGGRSPIAGIIHAVVLLLIFLFLSPLTAYIPMSCLAGVLIVVSYNMSGWRSIIAVSKGTKSDFLVLMTTFLLTVIFDLTIAIEIGLLLAMLIFMRRMIESTNILVSTDRIDLGNPENNKKEDKDNFINIPKNVAVYEIEGPYFFGIANRMEEQVIGQQLSAKVRIIRMRKVPFMDSTAIQNLNILYENIKKEGSLLILSGVSDSLKTLLKSAKMLDLIGEENICDDIHQAISRAEEYINTK